jgi:hypothetical protein
VHQDLAVSIRCRQNLAAATRTTAAAPAGDEAAGDEAPGEQAQAVYPEHARAMLEATTSAPSATCQIK